MSSTRSLPSSLATFRVLLWAEAVAFGRSARNLLWTALVPLLLLVLGRLQVPRGMRHLSAPTLEIAAFALTTGVFALGLFGYATALAGYRERGVFQRLRCTPAPAWQPLAARGLVELMAVGAQTFVIVAVSAVVYGASPRWPGIGLAALVALTAGLTALALGQAIVACTRSAGSVTAVARLTLFAFFFLEGAFVATRVWPHWLVQLADWTPVRITLRLLTDALLRQDWSPADGLRFLVLTGWTALLGWLGLTRFRWETD